MIDFNARYKPNTWYTLVYTRGADGIMGRELLESLPLVESTPKLERGTQPMVKYVPAFTDAMGMFQQAKQLELWHYV